MMTAKRKKKSVIAAFIAFIAALFLAIFGIVPQTGEEAKAYDGTFYFRGAPKITTTTISGRYQIRFNLIIAESVLGNGDSVTVSLSSNTDGAFLQRGHEGTILTDEDEEGQTQSVVFEKSVITFSGGYGSVYIDMYLNKYERGRLTATCTTTTAISDEYTVVSAIKVLLDEGKAPYTLAKIYDQYAGKDPTSETSALTMISNVVPTTYSSTSTTISYQAEIEIPSDILALGDKNAEAISKRSITSIPAIQRSIQFGSYYALCATVSTKDPTTQDIDARKADGILYRQFYLLKNGYPISRWMAGTSSDHFYDTSFYYQGQYTSNVGNSLSMNPSNGKTTVIFRDISAAPTTQLYFYVEVLEYYHEEEVYYGDDGPHVTNRTYNITSIFRSNVQKSSKRDIAKQILTNNSALTENERLNICRAVSIDTTQTQPLELIYKTYSSAGNYETKSQIYNIRIAAIFNKYSALKAMYDLSDIKDISGYNIVSKKQTYDSETGQIINAGDKILRQALDYEYVYDAAEGKAYATVIYDEFLYKDFTITIKNNAAENALEINYHTATVTVDNNVVTLIYEYGDIEERLLNSCGWLFDLEKDDFTVTGDSDALVGVEIGESSLSVRIPVKYQSDLFGLNITAVAEIVPDEDYTLKYTYYTGFAVSADGKTITPETGESAGIVIKLSKLKRLNDYSNFMNAYQSAINAPLNRFEAEYGVRYAAPKNVIMTTDSANKTCKITVQYEKESLFRVTDNLSSEWKYKQISHTTNVYTGDEFVTTRGGVEEGYRVNKFESGSSLLKITNHYEYEKAKAVFSGNTYAGDIYTVRIVFTDKWLIDINYMEQYKETPFAVKTKYSGEIRVKDYPDIYALTVSDLASILGKKSMSIVNNKSTVDTIKVTYDGIGKYTVDTTYTSMSIVQRDSDGKTQTEIQVPLSCYKDWCEDYGKDWSILYLNYAGKVFFRYSNDVKREDLYGFFSVAIFDDKASDLNDVFSSFDATGCMTFHQSEEIRGSRAYKFLRSDEGSLATLLTFSTIGLLTGHPIIGTVVGLAAQRIAISLCESPITDDENAIYHSYFFFLDGTSATPMITESGSTDPTDHDGAVKNQVDGIVDGVVDWWSGIWDGISNSTVAKILSIAIPIIVVLLLVSIVVKVIQWIFKKE